MMSERPARFNARRVFSDLDRNVATFVCEDDEQVLVIADGTAMALHKLLGRMSLVSYREHGLTDDEGSALSSLYHSLF